MIDDTYDTQWQSEAISSIPSYISESYFFVILCPSVTHEEGHVLGFESWAERGWCRLERMARNLSREDGFLISVQVAVFPVQTWDFLFFVDLFHGVSKLEGKITFC